MARSTNKAPNMRRVARAHGTTPRFILNIQLEPFERRAANWIHINYILQSGCRPAAFKNSMPIERFLLICRYGFFTDLRSILATENGRRGFSRASTTRQQSWVSLVDERNHIPMNAFAFPALKHKRCAIQSGRLLCERSEKKCGERIYPRSSRPANAHFFR